MRPLRSLLLAALALSLQIASVRAETVVRAVGNVDLNLVVPEGYCVLRESNAQDARFLNGIDALVRNSGGKLVLVLAECARLEALHAGKVGNITNYIDYYITNDSETVVFPSVSRTNRQVLCAEVRKLGDSTLDKVKEVFARTVEELHKNIELNNSHYIGVLDEDDHGCYSGVISDVKSPDRTTVMSGLIVSTVVRGKILFSAIYNEYEGPQTTDGEVKLGKEEAAALDEANP